MSLSALFLFGSCVASTSGSHEPGKRHPRLTCCAYMRRADHKEMAYSRGLFQEKTLIEHDTGHGARSAAGWCQPSTFSKHWHGQRARGTRKTAKEPNSQKTQQLLKLEIHGANLDFRKKQETPNKIARQLLICTTPCPSRLLCTPSLTAPGCDLRVKIKIYNTANPRTPNRLPDRTE